MLDPSLPTTNLAQAYAADPQETPPLLLLQCPRLTAVLSLIMGLMVYPEAMGETPDEEYPGPLTPGTGLLGREEDPDADFH